MTVSGLIILGLLLYFYLTPFWVSARQLPHDYHARVFWWNVAIGWTVVGWLGLLIWVLAKGYTLNTSQEAQRLNRAKEIADAKARTNAAFALPLTHPDGTANLDVTEEQLDALENEILVTSKDWL